jgi:hypothetical protein
MANWFGLSPSARERIREAWERAIVVSATEVLRHMPLIIGGSLTALVHLARTRLIPDDGRAWTVVLDVTLVLAELLAALGLALGSALELLGELAERTSVAINRVRETWRTGRRPPDKLIP